MMDANHPRLAVSCTLLRCWVAVAALLASDCCSGEELAGIHVRAEPAASPVSISLKMLARHRLQIDADGRSLESPARLQIELPISGANYWPVFDVEVRDAGGQPVERRHPGVGWERFSIELPTRLCRYVVQVAPTKPSGKRFPEQDRKVTDAEQRYEATVARWQGDRDAALCLRFDDAHPSHLTTVMPMLERYGYRATFMINPGLESTARGRKVASAYARYIDRWEAAARGGRHEFGNHTSHHRGAASDEEMDREIGEAARAIWRLFPHRSKLLSLNLGGGTWWRTRRPLRYYLQRYPSFVVTGSLGMDDAYGDRVAVFRRHLQRNLEGGLGWCKAHFHSVGDDLATSEANLRAVLETVRAQEKRLWITGLADAYKYLVERQSCRLEIVDATDNEMSLRVTCTTDPRLFDEPLTIRVSLPLDGRQPVRIVDSAGRNRESTISRRDGQVVVRFDVRPVTDTYRISSK